MRERQPLAPRTVEIILPTMIHADTMNFKYLIHCLGWTSSSRLVSASTRSTPLNSLLGACSSMIMFVPLRRMTFFSDFSFQTERREV